MKETLLFSVIMPNYNNGTYINNAIESVLVQTYTNWELVIVDDASTDNSLHVIKSFLNDTRIKLIKNAVNKGVAYVAKQAVENSSGEIIGTLDSDDVLLEDALAVMVNEYENNPEYGLIYSNHYQCGNNLKIRKNAPWLGSLPEDKSLQELLIQKLFEGVTVSMHFRTFRRSAYNKTEGYDPALLCYEDRDLYYKLEKVTRIKGINKCLYCYRDSNEAGAYRMNPKSEYYWFYCEYKETGRRLKIKLPFITKNKISPFFSNIMYMYLRNNVNINKEKLRRKLQSFLLDMGFNKLNKNKLIAVLYFLNSFLYGYMPITFNRIKKLWSLKYLENERL